MSVRKLLAKALILAVLEIGVYSGLRISPEEIDKLMNAMHRVRVVHVVKKDGK